MTFNATSYYVNKYRRQAWEYLARARERRAAGADAAAVGNMARLALINMRLAIGQRRIREIERRMRGG